MKLSALFPALALAISGTWTAAAQEIPQQDWTHHVRIGAYGLKTGSADAIVSDAQKSHVFGIEVDNDIPGRYESFLDPTEKLQAIRAVALAAHKAGNHAFVYIAGTECITAHADQAKRFSRRERRSGSVLGTRMCGSARTRRTGGKRTWSACGRSQRRELMESMWIFRTG